MMPRVAKDGKEYCGFCEEIVVVTRNDDEDVVWFTHYSHCMVVGHVFRTLYKFMRNEINGQTGEVMRRHFISEHMAGRID